MGFGGFGDESWGKGIGGILEVWEYIIIEPLKIRGVLFMYVIVI